MFEKRKATTQDKPAKADSSVPQESGSAPVHPNNPSEANTFNTRSTAMIGKTIVVNGNITGDENLVIEGTVEGSVELPGNDLTVGETGKVTANLNAKTIKIDGQVTGDMSGGEKVVISKTGRVKGNIVAPRVTLEDGAKFKGSIDMDPGDGRAAGNVKPAAVKSANTGADQAKSAGDAS